MTTSHPRGRPRSIVDNFFGSITIDKDGKPRMGGGAGTVARSSSSDIAQLTWMRIRRAYAIGMHQLRCVGEGKRTQSRSDRSRYHGISKHYDRPRSRNAWDSRVGFSQPSETYTRKRTEAINSLESDQRTGEYTCCPPGPALPASSSLFDVITPRHPPPSSC